MSKKRTIYKIGDNDTKFYLFFFYLFLFNLFLFNNFVISELLIIFVLNKFATMENLNRI